MRARAGDAKSAGKMSGRCTFSRAFLSTRAVFSRAFLPVLARRCAFFFFFSFCAMEEKALVEGLLDKSPPVEEAQLLQGKAGWKPRHVRLTASRLAYYKSGSVSSLSSLSRTAYLLSARPAVPRAAGPAPPPRPASPHAPVSPRAHSPARAASLIPLRTSNLTPPFVPPPRTRPRA